MQRTRLFHRLALFAGMVAGLGGPLHAASFLVDFGIAAGNPTQGAPTASPDSNGNYWNNVTSTAVAANIAGGTGVILPNLVSTTNTASTIGIALSAGWKSSGIANGGLNQATPALGTFGIQTATQDYYFVEAANGNATATQTITINNLDPQKSYDLSMFGSRNGTAAPFIRGTRYFVTDANGVHESVLQTTGPDLGGTGYHGNNSTIATLTGLYPTASGVIVLSVSNVHDSGIYTANQFAYLAALSITEGDAITPPALPTARIDFGIAAGNAANGAPTANPDTNGKYWNNVTSTTVATNIAGGTGLTLSNLVTTANAQTNWGIVLGNGWKSSGIANGGLVSPIASRLGELAISTATQDYYFTDGAAVSLQVNGLNPAKLYNFRMFGTRNVNTTRRTLYTLTAGNGVYASALQTSGVGIGNGTGGADGTDIYDGNNRNVITMSGVQTDSTGSLTLQVSVAEGGFAYLGLMEITEVASAPLLPPVAINNDVDRWTYQDAVDPVAPGGVLFVGSSSIRRWENLTKDFADYRVVQRGFGGSQFSDLNAIVNRIVTPYQPSAIVVFEGTNDIRVGNKTGEQVFADFQTFVNSVRAQQPNVPICYIGITPCPSFFNNPDHDPRRRTANTLIKNYCNSDPNLKLHFLDTNEALDTLHDTNVAEWNTYFVDDTHMNRKGYAHFTSVIRPALEAILAPNKTFTANPNTLVAGEKLFFDFGPSDVATGDPTPAADANGNRWNNWHLTNGGININAGEHLPNLVRSTGTNTGIRMVISGGFLCNGKASFGGLFAPQAGLLGELATETATEDFFYTSADDINNATSDDAPGGFMLEGLNPALSYEFRFLGARNNTQTRITKYDVSGSNSGTANLTTSGTAIGSTGGDNNDDEVAVISGIRPDAFGQVWVDLTLVQGDFAYINAMQITASTPPVTGTPIQNWRSAHFTAEELNNPALEASVWGDNADPDADGRSNLMEYANGSDPRAQDAGAQDFTLETTGEGDVLSLTYTKNLAATDVDFEVQSTDNLDDWNEVADTLVSTAGGIETRKASVSRSGFPQRWLRLKVALVSAN